MNDQHWLLLILWILYSVMHSFFADAVVKEGIQKAMGKRSGYYRLCYSLFAIMTLVILLWYQFSIESYGMYHSLIVRYSSMILILPGLIIMIICIRRYFYRQSGIQVLQKDKPPDTPTLQQDGLHGYTRHPLYFGTVLFVWGLWMLFPLLSNILAAGVITLYVLIGIELEEQKLLQEYGEEYRRYVARVPRFFPGLKARGGTKNKGFETKPFH